MHREGERYRDRGERSRQGSLTGKLADPPPGSEPWHTPWGHDRTLSVREFVAHVYPHADVDILVNRLEGQGLRRVVHETWYASDNDQADMVLLEFDSIDGALARYRETTYGAQLTSGLKGFVVPGSPRALGYYHSRPDQLGNVRAIVYGRFRNVVVEEFYFSRARIQKADAIAWMQRQLAALK